MTEMILNRRWWKFGLVQSALVFLSLAASWLLRFDFALPNLSLLFAATPILVGLRLGVMTFFDLHHDRWRHTGIPELEHLGKAVLIGSFSFLVFLRWVCGVTEFPLSIYVLEGLISMFFLSAPRIAVRMLVRSRQLRSSRNRREPVLIVGAGEAAALLLRELERTNYQAVGLADDDRSKLGTKIHGVSVVGTTDEIPRLTRKLNASEILIAIPSATGAQLLRITDLCQQAGVPFRTLPGLADILHSGVSISELRKVNVEELLGREPVKLKGDGILHRFRGRNLMITGAAGSIGSELCRQIAQYQPNKIVCVDQAETALFNLQTTLSGCDAEVIYAVTDITDTERMKYLLLEHDIQVLFHAAAHKHVPLTEQNLYDGLKNNVFGPLRLVEAAEQCGCEDFLLISSDKAVNPSSFMGCTKRLGELIVGSRKSMRMRCVSVRFGNVLGSQGSVIPVFQEQIRTKRCITVTHPDMTRYFMTIPEAVSLVLQAFSVGEAGSILVLDMGKPVRILDLARTLIRLSGLKEEEIRIVYSGIRPGEKLYEKLFYDSERSLPTPVTKIACAQTALPDWIDLHRQLAELERIARRGDDDSIRSKVKEIIPEYQWEPASSSLSAIDRHKPKLIPIETILAANMPHPVRSHPVPLPAEVGSL